MGTLVIIVALPPADFSQVAHDFMRNLSILLHSVVTVKRDSNGDDMIYEWPRNSRMRRSLMTSYGRTRRDHVQG